MAVVRDAAGQATPALRAPRADGNAALSGVYGKRSSTAIDQPGRAGSASARSPRR